MTSLVDVLGFLGLFCQSHLDLFSLVKKKSELGIRENVW